MFQCPSHKRSTVAIVLVGEELDRRDIIIQRGNEALQRIAETNSSYDSLQYPIIFWEGDDGYQFSFRQTETRTGRPSNKKVTAIDVYGYRIVTRQGSSNPILQCRQLFHQLLIL